MILKRGHVIDDKRAYGSRAKTCTETAMANLYAIFKEELSCSDIGQGYKLYIRARCADGQFRSIMIYGPSA